MNKSNRLKSHFLTFEQKKMPLIMYLSGETINVAYKMHKFYLPKLKLVNFNSQMGLNFNRYFTKFPNGEKM